MASDPDRGTPDTHFISSGRKDPSLPREISQYCCTVAGMQENPLGLFAIDLYETRDGQPVVADELDAIERQTPVLHALLVAGLSKLRHREYHRPPLCEPLGGRLFELRVGRKDIARAVWFYREGQRIVVVRCFIKKSQKTPASELQLARARLADYLKRHSG